MACCLSLRGGVLGQPDEKWPLVQAWKSASGATAGTPFRCRVRVLIVALEGMVSPGPLNKTRKRCCQTVSDGCGFNDQHARLAECAHQNHFDLAQSLSSFRIFFGGGEIVEALWASWKKIIPWGNDRPTQGPDIGDTSLSASTCPRKYNHTQSSTLAG